MEKPNTAASSKAAGFPLKLLIDRRTKTVVFGEAGKELVDFLFSLLSLPLATIVGLLGTHSVPGSLGKLFDSIEKLDNTYILTKSSTPKQVKEELLNPTLPPNIYKVGLKKLPWNSPLPAGDEMLLYSCHGSSCIYYKCADCCYRQVASVSGTRCPSCAGKICCKVQFLKSSNKRKFLKSSNSSSPPAIKTIDHQRDVEGFVQGVVTYTITDELTISPLSTISAVLLRVHDLATLEERIVTVGRHESMVLLFTISISAVL
ncbi:hypothetical protein EJ110_NYTH48347 [Nymphaea thermarum]|nr:hypothetical protein EJ110_NYTH48347 [Nymphaea thermarum]